MSTAAKVWAAVALVGILVAAVVCLSLFNKSTEPLQTIISAVLIGVGGLLYQKIDNVEKHVNGTQTKLIDAAIASPPVPIPPPTELTEENGESKTA